MSEREFNISSLKLFSVTEYRTAIEKLKTLKELLDSADSISKKNIEAEITATIIVLAIKITTATTLLVISIDSDLAASFMWSVYKPILPLLDISNKKDLLPITEHLYIGLVATALKDNASSSENPHITSPVIIYLQHLFFKARRRLLRKYLQTEKSSQDSNLNLSE